MDNIDYNDLSSKDPVIKYGCAKRLLAAAKEDPAQLYPRLDFFVSLLDGENRILKWTAIDVIGQLARVDTAGDVDKLTGRLFALLGAGNMITANHAITALANIARTKPEHQNRITREILKVEHYSFDTSECRNIAVGTAIVAIGSYFDQLPDKEAAVAFARRQTKNTRNATRKKAEQFLKKHGLEG